MNILRIVANHVSNFFAPPPIKDDIAIKTVVRAKYQWDGEYYFGRIWSKDIDSTYTIEWYFGCLQVGTERSEIELVHGVAWDDVVLLKPSSNSTKENSENDDNTNEEEEDNIYLASRRGDLAGVKAFVESGVPVDVPEVVDGEQTLSRTPLYWACLTGHVALVQYLLEQGAVDHDESAFAAVTGSKPVLASSDQRDLLFDPDENIYSDFVERGAEAHMQSTREIEAQDGTSAIIRTLLLDARRRKHVDQLTLGTGLHRVPVKVFQSANAMGDGSTSSTVCAVCLDAPVNAVCNPCGHAVACNTCLLRIRRSREGGCPVCRGQIRDINLIDVQDNPTLV